MAGAAEFRARAKAVRAYLRSLEALETLHKQPGRNFYRAAPTITASRAAAFIMIYNCVEFATRDSLAVLRKSIAADVVNFSDLGDYWKEEIVRQKYYQRLREGSNFAVILKDFSEFMPGVVDWGNSMSDLPFAGNIDHLQLHRFVARIGGKWTAPKKSLGGVDLQLVRNMRNDLAHGEETFEAVGGLFTTKDLIERFERIRLFVLAYLKMIDRYAQKQRYRRA